VPGGRVREHDERTPPFAVADASPVAGGAAVALEPAMSITATAAEAVAARLTILSADNENSFVPGALS
jgi:hypothetical protein